MVKYFDYTGFKSDANINYITLYKIPHTESSAKKIYWLHDFINNISKNVAPPNIFTGLNVATYNVIINGHRVKSVGLKLIQGFLIVGFVPKGNIKGFRYIVFIKNLSNIHYEQILGLNEIEIYKDAPPYYDIYETDLDGLKSIIQSIEDYYTINNIK